LFLADFVTIIFIVILQCTAL